MHAVSARAVRTASAVSMLFFLSACSSGPSIVTNAAPDFDLVGYQTFSYLQPLSTDNGNVRTIISTELIDATTGRLQNAGLRYVERGGDLLVNFVVSTRETLQTRSTPSSGMSVHHGMGRYGTWGGYSMSMSTTEVVQRTEGTIAIDIIDGQRKQLVWEGAATGRITDKARQNRAAAIDMAVGEILEQFP